MFDRHEKHKWFSFVGSLINLNYVMRIYTDKDKPRLTIEFHPTGHSYYDFHTMEDREAALEKIWQRLSKD